MQLRVDIVSQLGGTGDLLFLFVCPSMKTLTRTLFITLLLAFFSQSAVAAVLEKVTNQSIEDGRAVVNLFFNGQSKPEIFFIPGDSPRLVLDFPDTSYKGQQKIAADSALLQAIRIATHPNPLKTRVVFDLRTGSVDYKQEFLEDGHILRVSLSGKGQPPLKTKTAAVAPKAPAKAETAVSPPVKTETAVPPPAKAETVASPPVKAETAVPPPTKPKAEEPKAVAPPAAKETPFSPSAALPAKPPAETPLAAQERVEQEASGAAKSAASSPFDGPFHAAEPPGKPGSAVPAPAKPALAQPVPAGSVPAVPAEKNTPAATQLLGYSLVNQPEEKDVLHLQLDGYANPEITAYEGQQPQLECFFPKMRLAVKKGLNRPLSGKFIRKMVAETQKKPAGVRLLIDLQSGYDYYIQKIFNADESAFFLVVNVSSPKH